MKAVRRRAFSAGSANRQERVFFFLAVRADALHHQPVPQDLIACFLRQSRIVFPVIGAVYIQNAAADHAPHMVMRIRPQIKAVAIGHHDPKDLLIVAQQVQIAVNSPPADMGIQRVDILEDLFCCGVIPAAAYFVQHQLPLAGIPLLFHVHHLACRSGLILPENRRKRKFLAASEFWEPQAGGGKRPLRKNKGGVLGGFSRFVTVYSFTSPAIYVMLKQTVHGVM